MDEGHRLKNMDCRLMQEVKRYESAWRMVLSGTPLQVRFSLRLCIIFILSPTLICLRVVVQNNLAELWSLLNFILPDIFNDLDSFQEWYVPTTLLFHSTH